MTENNINSALILQALEFASIKHRDQRRKDVEASPYINIDFQTVLVAPRWFYERNASEAGKFDCYISHEEISEHIAIFKA